MQVYFWAGHYGRVVNEAAEPLGEILAEAGDTFAAYRMFRDHGHGQKAERVLRTSGLAEQLIADLEQERAKQAERLESARAESIDDLRSIELDYYTPLSER